MVDRLRLCGECLKPQPLHSMADRALIISNRQMNQRHLRTRIPIRFEMDHDLCSMRPTRIAIESSELGLNSQVMMLRAISRSLTRMIR